MLRSRRPLIRLYNPAQDVLAGSARDRPFAAELPGNVAPPRSKRRQRIELVPDRLGSNGRITCRRTDRLRFQDLQRLVQYAESAPLQRLDVTGIERRKICGQCPPWRTSGTHPENGVEDCARVAALVAEAVLPIFGEQVTNTSPRGVGEGWKH